MGVELKGCIGYTGRLTASMCWHAAGVDHGLHLLSVLSGVGRSAERASEL